MASNASDIAFEPHNNLVLAILHSSGQEGVAERDAVDPVTHLALLDIRL